MRLFILFLVCLSFLKAGENSTVVSTYYENLDFKNSFNKSHADFLGVDLNTQIDKNSFRIAYEHLGADTKQPPASDNFYTDTLFLRYGYSINDKVKINFNYINILYDNLSPTANGAVYGGGISYLPNKTIGLNFTQYFSDYRDFDVYESDLKLTYKMKLGDAKVKISAIAKYIKLADYETFWYTKNAQESYFTPGISINTNYNSYLFGLGAYFGKRAYAVLADGFKLQERPLEYNKTYAIGLGKKIGDFTIKIKYVYLEATELPPKREGVELQKFVLRLSYKL